MHIVPGSGCTFEDNWYQSCALRIKDRFPSLRADILRAANDVDNVPITASSVAADIVAGGWKSRALMLVLESAAAAATILVGHSQGANAIMRAVERGAGQHRIAGLVLFNAGHTEHDYLEDRMTRDQGTGAGIGDWRRLEPWMFERIVANVRGASECSDGFIWISHACD